MDASYHDGPKIRLAYFSDDRFTVERCTAQLQLPVVATKTDLARQTDAGFCKTAQGAESSGGYRIWRAIPPPRGAAGCANTRVSKGAYAPMLHDT